MQNIHPAMRSDYTAAFSVEIVGVQEVKKRTEILDFLQKSITGNRVRLNSTKDLVQEVVKQKDIEVYTI